MQRRDFVKLSLAGAALTLSAPSVSLAEAAKPITPGADIYFTQEAQGRWAGKAATHLPNIEIVKSGDEVVVKVITAHEMKGYEHYIVKHVLLDKDYKFLQEHLFDPSKDSTATSSFKLKNYSGVIYALSLCNKHDAWLSQAEV